MPELCKKEICNENRCNLRIEKISKALSLLIRWQISIICFVTREKAVPDYEEFLLALTDEELDQETKTG